MTIGETWWPFALLGLFLSVRTMYSPSSSAQTGYRDGLEVLNENRFLRSVVLGARNSGVFVPGTHQ
jgi:hypothetical protein